MRRFLILLAALVPLASAAFAAKQRSLSEIGVRAERFYAQKEWASAAAMYSLMIDERPDSARLYGRAVTAAAMRGETGEQRMLLRRALEAKVPIDSVFHYVEVSSFALGEASVLEKFLKLAVESEPWLSRKIDASLLDYYTFRRDGAAMVSYARRLLNGMPDSEKFGLRLAEGLLIEGRSGEAAKAFADVLVHHPSSLQALLYLGEMSLRKGDYVAAEHYLSRANAIDSTPHLVATLNQLRDRETSTTQD